VVFAMAELGFGISQGNQDSEQSSSFVAGLPLAGRYPRHVHTYCVANAHRTTAFPIPPSIRTAHASQITGLTFGETGGKKYDVTLTCLPLST